MNAETDAAPAADLTDPATFRHWTPVTMRFSDQDVMGHINNVAYAAYYESGRNDFASQLLETAGCGGVDFVIVRITIDYLNQMRYPGTADVGTRVLRLGNKSMTIGHGIFFEGKAMSTAEGVVAFVDVDSGTSIPMPQAVRAVLEKEMPSGASG